MVTRRCNLSCGYCNEYDNFSQPVPLAILKERIDALHRLGAIHITLLGGEPLLHPNIAELVAYAERKAQVSITTNGFLLSEKLIDQLNEAGLSNMQLSVDTFKTDGSGYIQKSLKTIRPKLDRLVRRAKFGVAVNIVLCEASKGQLETIIQELKRVGLPLSVGLIHDEKGRIQINGSDLLDLWEYSFNEGKILSFIEYGYGKKLLQGQKPEWQCRAGARYLYIDEFGNVQFCSAQRRRLDKPVVEYTREDINEHAQTHKGCESGCSIFCVFRSSQVDNAPLRAAWAFYKIQRKVDMAGKNAVVWRNGSGIPIESSP